MASRIPPTPRPVPEYDVEYEDYSTRYASPLKKGQAILGYRSISPNKHHPSAADYDTVDNAGGYSDSPMYRDKTSGGRPDIRDGAEAGEALNGGGKLGDVRSRLNFSGEDDSPGIGSYQAVGKDYNTPTSDNRYGKGYPIAPGPEGNDSPFLLSKASSPPQYDPKQYQDKVIFSVSTFVCRIL